MERESGNSYFEKGDFHEAIKCYTRSIALNRRNHLSYSNRAMAYLKIKDYDKVVTSSTVEHRSGMLKLTLSFAYFRLRRTPPMPLS